MTVPSRGARRRRLGFILGIVIAALGMILVVVLRNTQTTPTGPTQAAVVATADIPAGTLLTSANVAIANLPASAVPATAFTTTTDVIGKYSTQPLSMREVVVAVDVSASASVTPAPQVSGGGLALTTGFVAIAVPVDPVTAAGYYIQPGDHVDMIVVRQDGTLRYGLQDVAVLEVGGRQTSGATDIRSDSLLVVTVPRRQAEEIAALVNGCPSQCGPVHIAKLVVRARADWGKGPMANGADDVLTGSGDPSIGPAQLEALFSK